MRIFVGSNNEVRINRATVEAALTEWLNDGQFSAGLLIIQGIRYHLDGSITIEFATEKAAAVAKHIVAAKDAAA